MAALEHEAKNPNKPEDPSEGVVSVTRLLARKPEGKYIEEWTEIIGKKLEEKRIQEQVCVIIFRLGGRWLAIPAIVFSEVFRDCVIHTIPSKSNAVLLGLVNFRGKLTLCVNMRQLLEIESTPNDMNFSQRAKTVQHTMVAIQKAGESWVFPVAELSGIYCCNAASIENLSQQMLKAKDNYLRGFIKWKNMQVGLLDEELLFSKLRMVIT